jgi:hypothetical protein
VGEWLRNLAAVPERSYRILQELERILEVL